MSSNKYCVLIKSFCARSCWVS